PIDIAIENDDLDLFELLLEFKAEVNREARQETTPPLLRAWGKRLVLERLLALKETNVNIANRHGVTVLHLAPRDGDVVLVRRLLDRGADVNARSEGQTPLDWAVREKHSEVVRLLKERGKG